MPSLQRHATGYPGIYYVLLRNGERQYYARYYLDGRARDERVGRSRRNAMTAARAAEIRFRRMRDDPEAMPLRRRGQGQSWTFTRVWEEYRRRVALRYPAREESRFRRHIEPSLGCRPVGSIRSEEIERLRDQLLSTLSPQTVRLVLAQARMLLRWAGRHLCRVPEIHVKLPRASQEKTEDLSRDQLARLLQVLAEDPNRQVASAMHLALLTGMRRGELFRLRWEDVDAERGFLRILQPKGGKDATIPLSCAAVEVLDALPREAEYVFPGPGGRQRLEAKTAVTRIAKAAGLPAGFRPFHGLRHVFASTLASSGQVDLYTLQRLLTHKSPAMTQRYAHLRDEALRKAAEVAGEALGGKD